MSSATNEKYRGPAGDLADPSTTVLSARKLIKTFGKVIGLDGVDLDLFPGEVLAIIGDNGAGKSTLVKALSGNLALDSGTIRLLCVAVDHDRNRSAPPPSWNISTRTSCAAPAPGDPHHAGPALPDRDLARDDHGLG